MKKLVKKCIGYALIFGFTMPACGYTWTVYNGLPEYVLVQMNVSDQVSQQEIAPGGSVPFDYSASWRWGLCLTTIYVEDMSSPSPHLQPTKLGNLAEDEFEHAIKALPDLIKAIEKAAEIEEDPLNVLPAIVDAFKFLKEIIAMLVELIHDLCSTGTWIITKDPKTGQLHSIRKELTT